MNRFFTALARVLRPGAVGEGRADPDTFRRFLGSRVAFIAQKTVMDYCGVKFGVRWQAAQADPGFAAVLASCRWAVFWAVAGDLAVATGGWLLPHTADPAAMLAGLRDLAAAALDEAGADGDPTARAVAEDIIDRRLAALSDEPPAGPATMTLAAGPVLLETMPIHPDQRKGERAAILGGLRMNLIAVMQDMQRQFDPAALAAALAAAPAPHPAS